MNKTKDVRDAFFDEVFKIAKENRDVIVLAADMGSLSLQRLQEELPNQYVNVGIAEQNMLAVAAGLAKSGKKVFVYSIAPFTTMRCYEQIKVLISDMNLSINIVGGGAGFTYGNDGSTHHAIHDLAIMRIMENFRIYTPCDALSAQSTARHVYESQHPTYTRIDKGTVPDLYKSMHIDEITKLKEGTDGYIVSTGVMTHTAMKVSMILEKENISIGVIDVIQLSAITKTILEKLINAKNILTLEENLTNGGIGTAVCEELINSTRGYHIERMGVKNFNSIMGNGSREWLHKKLGIDIEDVCNKLKFFLYDSSIDY